MDLIKIDPYEDGSHATMVTNGHIPVGYAVVPVGLPRPATYPFVALTLDGCAVTAMDANQADYDAWVAAQREAEQTQEPTDSERLSDVETLLLELAGVI